MTDDDALPEDREDRPVGGSPRRSGASRPALRAAAAYAVLGGIWILISDRVVDALFESQLARGRVQTIKGLAFVLGSALVVFWIRRFEPVLRRRAERAERELDSVRGELRRVDARRREMVEMVTKVLDAQEAERMRLAADIHDDPIQAMTAVGLRLAPLRARLRDPEDVAALERLEQAVQEAIARMRSLLFELRPPALDEFGLAAALHQSVERLAETTKAEARFEGQLAAEPDPTTRLILYRVAQEAMTNVRKHAHAHRVRVFVDKGDGGVRLRVEDDGVGVGGPEEPGGYGHLGFIGMRERVEAVGGTLSVGPGPAGGTLVEAWVPLEPA